MNILRLNVPALLCALLSAAGSIRLQVDRRWKIGARLDTIRTACSHYFSSRATAYGSSPKSRSQRALCWSSETLPCFSSRRFDPPPPNSTIYRATVERPPPSLNSSIYHRGEPRWLYPIRPFYASIAFSWHTVMKIYREAYVGGRRRTRGGIIEMAYCRSRKVSDVLSTVSSPPSPVVLWENGRDRRTAPSILNFL